VVRARERAVRAHALGDYPTSHRHLSDALATAMESQELFLLRADCALHMGEYTSVKHDALRVLRAAPRSTRAVYLISAASFKILADLNATLVNLRFCLRIDAKYQPCARLYTTAAALDAAFKNADEATVAGDYGDALKAYATAADGR
jgi:hypothetical protein